MILLVAEHNGTALAKSTAEMVTAAGTLRREGPITILVLGHNVGRIADEAALLAEQVLVADGPELAEYDVELWTAVAAYVAREGEASAVIVGGSRSGREYSPRLAVRLGAALLEDVIGLASEGANVRAQRYAFLARVTETIEAQSAVVVISVKPGAFDPAVKRAEAGEQFEVEMELPPRRMHVTERSVERAAQVSLTEADVVVAGGRGVGSPERFAKLVEGLASELGGAVAATRAAVDAGWRPYSEQVGQTGKSVAPKLYIAVGVSGAVQHLSGMSKSGTIVALNKDPEASIFKIADYGIVGDVTLVVPALISELQKR